MLGIDRDRFRRFRQGVAAMIEVSGGDLQLMDQFPLKWRWNDPKRLQPPQEIQTTISPLSASKAAEIWDTRRFLTCSGSLAPKLFEGIIKFNAMSVDRQQVCAWLGQLGVTRELTVLLSWRQDLAVSVPFGVFCDLWDAFCYPRTDNVVICPCSQEWAIFYHYANVLSFGQRRP